MHFSLKRVTVLALALMLALVGSAATVNITRADGGTRSIAISGSASPQTGGFTPSGSGDATQVEFAGQMDTAAGPGPYKGVILDRSLSRGRGDGENVRGNDESNSHPTFVNGFEGLNHYQQRYARGGNQFSIEPPDQGLCVGNGYELEAVNDVLNVFNASGQSVLPDNTAANVVAGFPRNVNHAVDLNSFFGYPAAVNRSTGALGPELTDPSCLYDAQTQRFFLVVLTLDRLSSGALSHVNHLDLAVSKTSNPTGLWNIYKIDVTNDGTNTGGVNPCPCLGDYPHIGADTNGFYITTNSYPWCCNGFSGAQIYALSKAQLAAGAATITTVHLDTSGMVNVPSDAGPTQPGFTVWPAQSPAKQDRRDENSDDDRRGVEYFMSSNAADEATHPVAGTGGNYVSSQLVVWSLANTASLNSATPSLNLTNKVTKSERYALPPKLKQPGSGSAPTTAAPLGYCINNVSTTLFNTQVGCWRLLFGAEPAHTEVVSTPDSNDTRMQQVTYANGKLWASLDTALNPGGGAQRAGIAWFIVNPHSAKIENQGYLGAAGHDFAYPAIGVTANGQGLIAFTASGDALYPSAAYAPISSDGVGTWGIAPGGKGMAPADGFTSYAAEVGSPPRTRWGDYGAAVTDGNSVWTASEYIAHACSYTDWGGPFFAGGSGDNLLGTCAGPSHGPGVRTALANWSTRISKFTLKEGDSK